MVKRNISILKSVILAAASLAAASCVPDRDYPKPKAPISDEVVVRFSMSMPNPGPSATRAADDAEFAVNNISLLVFVQEDVAGDFTYRYTAVGRRLDQPGNTAVDFEALLTDSEDPVRLLAVANHADGFLDAIVEGTTEAEVRSALVSSSTDFSRGLPMTGVAELASLSDATGIVRIPLIRSVAKATVTVLLDGSSPDFTITGVEVWRNPTEWQFLPDALCIENETTAPVPLAPSVQFTEDVVNRELNAVGNGQLYSGYVFETAIPSGLDEGDDPAAMAACIIVRGRFADDGEDTYYRINFGRLGDPANPLGQVLRNYWYEFTIVGVEGSGWESAQRAAENPAAGLRTTATPWSGGGNTDYYFGHNDYIKLSAASMVLDAQADHTATMTITTSGLPFTVTSVHDPAAGPLDTSYPNRQLVTDKMRFEITSLTTDVPGEQRWQLTVTALTSESVVDYLQLHAAGGLMTINIFIQRYPPPGHEPHDNDPTKRRIRVLTLGINTYGSLHRQTNYGVPAMLRNTGYFGPTGTVPCAGIDILPITMNETTAENSVEAVNTALAGADIIVTTYDYHPSEAVSQAIYEWITGPESKGRVAFLISDATLIIQHLRGYLDGRMRWIYNPANLTNDQDPYYGYGSGYTGLVPAPRDSDNAPFIDGVFGNAGDCAILRGRPYDGVSQYINIANVTSSPTIVPLMITDGSSGINNNIMLMGVDTQRHIVYIGDAILLHTEGIGTTANSSLAYDPANYINVLWSNTWAWAIDKVMTENYDVEGALVE